MLLSVACRGNNIGLPNLKWYNLWQMGFFSLTVVLVNGRVEKYYKDYSYTFCQ